MHTGFSSPAYGSAALRSARISPADSTSNVCVRLGSVSGWAVCPAGQAVDPGRRIRHME